MAMDYPHDWFGPGMGTGYFRVFYGGGTQTPKGPYDSIAELARGEGLHEYPDDGYIVYFQVGDAGPTNVPSLNPDDLVPRTYQVEVQRMVTTKVTVTATDAQDARDKVDSRDFPLEPLDTWEPIDGYSYVVYDETGEEELLRDD